MHTDIAQALSNPQVQLQTVRAQWIAQQLLGDTVFANALLLGLAWQRGYLPLHLAALRQAIELNGVKVAENLLAFELGRLAAQNPEALDKLFNQTDIPATQETAEELLLRCHRELALYQNTAFADRFAARLKSLHALFNQHAEPGLAEVLWTRFCRTYFKLLAYKDEFEVARLHTDLAWANTTRTQFEPGAKMVFHFAPTWLVGHAARPKKIRLGQWAIPILKAVAALRVVRGSWLDPFRGSLERKNQTLLVTWFESWMELMHNNPSMLQYSMEISRTLELFNAVKGFGQVRIESFEKARFEIQNSVQYKPNLDQHDQDRQQT